MQVTFFGVRGSCPCAGERYRRTGGNTACVLVRAIGEPPLVLDLGTGLRALGEVLRGEARREGRPLQASALLSHLHFDHILGLPFFAPLHDRGSHLDVYGPRPGDRELRDALHSAVQPPFFPVHMSAFRGDLSFHEVGDDDFTVGGIGVRARQVPHQGTTLGFRVEADGASVAYLPDHQAPADRRSVDDRVLELCDDADLVIHDAQYDDDEFAGKCDWGHSTAAYAVRVAARARAKRLLLFHHDPSHDDGQVDRLLERALQLPDAAGVGEVAVATEGLTVDLDRPPPER